MDDYQWPQPTFTSGDRYLTDRPSERTTLVDAIEGYFKNIFGVEVILVPSGRAAITILLKYLGINRSHTVFTPKWTPPCVIDVVGRISNPNTIYTRHCDVAIVVHKWGQAVRFSEKSDAYLIEDSVDSIVTSSETLFPNLGNVEIFSLPKIIGSYTGGLIIVKTKQLADDIRASLIADDKLARYQSRLRYYSVKGIESGFHSWLHLESKNTSLDYNGLVHIHGCLRNFEVNSQVIVRRLTILKKRFKDIKITLGRLPPVIPLDAERHPIKKGAAVITRYYSGTGYIDEPNYRPAHIIPLHFGVGDQLFSKILNSFR